MKAKDVDITQVTLLHETNLKFLQGKMPEPINDFEILENIELQWESLQPKFWVILFEIGLGVLLLGIAITYWIFILVSFALDYQSFIDQTMMEMLGVLSVNVIILGLTGLCGWSGIYILKYLVVQHRDRNNQPTPDVILEKMLEAPDFITGHILQFLNAEKTQVVIHVDGKRRIYWLREASQLKESNLVLLLILEQYIALL